MPSTIDPDVTDTIDAIEQATITKSVIQHGAIGKAYQSIALSSAIAVQDATDQLRSTGVLALSATGSGIAKMIETGDTQQFNQTIDDINKMLHNSVSVFSAVTQAASDMLAEFSKDMQGLQPADE